MYQVLYRKWRPKTFEDVSGQKHITDTLINEVTTDRLNHAYLFTGSRGTGKTTCAKILSKAVNCLSPVNGSPCGECEICKGIDDGSVLDIIEMDAASNRNLEDIRQIIDEVQFKPARCRYRVYIVDEVHMLTNQAFNALLKTLEEPPKHVIFILATTEVHKLPQTILSRCQRFDFHRIKPSEIADRIKYVSQQENVNISDSAALLVASVADGALRDALSLLDRCIAISSDIDEDVVRSAAGLARKTYLFELAAGAINKNTSKALDIVDRLYKESKDMSRLCDELIGHFRALMLIKSVKAPRDILVMSDDEFEQAQTQADYLSLADIVYYMDVLSRSYQRMGKGTSDRTELEMALVKLTSAQLDGTVEALTQRVTALEKAVKSGIRVSVEPQTAVEVQTEEYETDDAVVDTLTDIKTEPEKKPVPHTTVPPKPSEPSTPPQQKKAVNAEEIYRNAKPFAEWSEVVNAVMSKTRSLGAALLGTKAYISGAYLLIDSENELAFELMRDSKRKEQIRQILLETTGRSYKFGPYKRPKQKTADNDPIDGLIDSLKASGIKYTEE